jgi:hypothetical protein
MGTFGCRNFQNDSAMDFEDEFKEMPSATTVRSNLLSIVNSVECGRNIEYDEACKALAAAETVAASIGKPSLDFPIDLQPVIQSLVLDKDARIRQLARKVVKQVVKHSELQELWAEDGEPNEWQAVQQDLLVRLK